MVYQSRQILEHTNAACTYFRPVSICFCILASCIPLSQAYNRATTGLLLIEQLVIAVEEVSPVEFAIFHSDLRAFIKLSCQMKTLEKL